MKHMREKVTQLHTSSITHNPLVVLSSLAVHKQWQMTFEDAWACLDKHLDSGVAWMQGTVALGVLWRLYVCKGEQPYYVPLHVHCGEGEVGPLQPEDHKESLTEGTVPHALPIITGLTGGGVFEKDFFIL